MAANRIPNPQYYDETTIICSTPTFIKRAVWSSVGANGHSLRMSCGGGVDVILCQGTAGANHLVLENYLSSGVLTITYMDSGKLQVYVE